jgi:hypothetical protein
MMWIFITIAGFVIGLGAVTVIDLHGFLGRKSGYWTQATIRTHKVTKPLIWVGTFIAIVGSVGLYWSDGWTVLHGVQTMIASLLVLNGAWLTFWLSPRLLTREGEGKDQEVLPSSWQRAITISFLVSFVGWWSEVALFAWHLSI